MCATFESVLANMFMGRCFRNVVILLVVASVEYADGQSCIISEQRNFSSPVPVPNTFETVYTFQFIQELTTTLDTSDASISCIRAYLTSYFQSMSCTEGDTTTGFQYASLVDDKPDLTTGLSQWTYTATFSYTTFSTNCLNDVDVLFGEILTVGPAMQDVWVNGRPATCSSYTANFLPNSQCMPASCLTYEAINLAQICQYLTCAGQTSASNQTLYLRCVNPNTRCLKAQCLATCTPALDEIIPARQYYCYNGGACVQNAEEPVTPATCDCGVAGSSTVYYTGSQCQTKLYLWWFILIGIAVILIIILIITLFCCREWMLAFLCCCFPCCPCYRGCPYYKGQCCKFRLYDGGSEYKEKPVRPPSITLQPTIEPKKTDGSSTYENNAPFTMDPSIRTMASTVVRGEPRMGRAPDTEVRRPPADTATAHEPRRITHIPVAASPTLRSTSSSSSSTSSTTGTVPKHPRGIISAAYEDSMYDRHSALAGDRVEIDAVSYASTAELRSMKRQRWINPGTLKPARIKAKKTPTIEYGREGPEGRDYNSDSSIIETRQTRYSLKKRAKHAAPAHHRPVSNLNAAFSDSEAEDQVPPLPAVGPNAGFRPRAGWVPTIGPAAGDGYNPHLNRLVSAPPPRRRTPLDLDPTGRASSLAPRNYDFDALSDLTELPVDGSVIGREPIHMRAYLREKQKRGSDRSRSLSPVRSSYDRHLSGRTIVETGDPAKRRTDIDFSTVNLVF